MHKIETEGWVDWNFLSIKIVGTIVGAIGGTHTFYPPCHCSLKMLRMEQQWWVSTWSWSPMSGVHSTRRSTSQWLSTYLGRTWTWTYPPGVSVPKMMSLLVRWQLSHLVYRQGEDYGVGQGLYQKQLLSRGDTPVKVPSLWGIAVT